VYSKKKPVRLTSSEEAEFAPEWSPDGRWIVYSRGPMTAGHANLWIMNADGSDQKPLTPRGEWDDYDPAWSPDGTRIAFESNRGGDFDIWVIPAP
jgi:Tol biopolymer transport system component